MDDNTFGQQNQPTTPEESQDIDNLLSDDSGQSHVDDDANGEGAETSQETALEATETPQQTPRKRKRTRQAARPSYDFDEGIPWPFLDAAMAFMNTYSATLSDHQRIAYLSAFGYSEPETARPASEVLRYALSDRDTDIATMNLAIPFMDKVLDNGGQNATWSVMLSLTNEFQSFDETYQLTVSRFISGLAWDKLEDDQDLFTEDSLRNFTSTMSALTAITNAGPDHVRYIKETARIFQNACQSLIDAAA